MTTVGIASSPDRRMGIYKRLSDVPDRYRLDQYNAAYEGRDVWTEYVAEQADRGDPGEWFFQITDRVGRRWKAHMDERGRHHALATPDDVETWVGSLLDELSMSTTYETYWIRLEEFYSWLQYHTEYPHVYHPVLMAAAEDGAAGQVWARKIETGIEAARAYERGELR